MSEKTIENQIKRYLKSLEGCWFVKHWGGGRSQAGIPDILVCYHGRFCAFEVKDKYGKATPLQEITLEDIRQAGGVGVVVRSIEEVKEALGT